jgi:hypothetical protein
VPRSPRRVTLCGHALDDVRHVCAFFDSVDEQYETLNPGPALASAMMTVLTAAPSRPGRS